MKFQNCKLEYRKLTTSKLGIFAGHVRNGIYNNSAVFSSPSVTVSAFDTSRSEYTKASANYEIYGITQKTNLAVARASLIADLDKLAIYVDNVAQGNVSQIFLSGFTPSRDKYKRVAELDKIPHFVLKTTGVIGGTKVIIPVVANKGAISYGCVCVEGAPLTDGIFIDGQFAVPANSPQIYYDCNKSRTKIFPRLKPGVLYYFYVFASNSTSVSPLSDAKSIWVS